MTRPHAGGALPSRLRRDLGLHAGRTARRARAHRPRPGRAGADVGRRPGRLRRRSSGGGAAAAGPGDDGGDRRGRGAGRHELRGRRGWRSRARRAVGGPRRLAPRRLDGERAPVDARRDGRCPHRRACAVAGRGAGGGDAAGARPPRLLQPGVADLPLRRWRRRAARRARWRLRAGRGARGVAAAGHRPRRAAGAGVAGRHPGLGGRARVPTRCAPTPRPDWTRSSAARARARRCRWWTSCRGSRSSGWWLAQRRPCGSRRTRRPSTPPMGRCRPRRASSGTSPGPPARTASSPATPGGQRLPAGAARRRRSRGAALALRRRAVVPVSRGPHALGRRPGASGWRAGCGSRWPWPRRCCGRRSGR